MGMYWIPTIVKFQFVTQDIKIKLPEKNSSYQLEKLKQLQQDQKIFNSNNYEKVYTDDNYTTDYRAINCIKL